MFFQADPQCFSGEPSPGWELGAQPPHSLRYSAAAWAWASPPSARDLGESSSARGPVLSPRSAAGRSPPVFTGLLRAACPLPSACARPFRRARPLEPSSAPGAVRCLQPHAAVSSRTRLRHFSPCRCAPGLERTNSFPKSTHAVGASLRPEPGHPQNLPFTADCALGRRREGIS